MSQLKTLQEAANTAPGAFISGGFQANVSKVLALQGKKLEKHSGNALLVKAVLKSLRLALVVTCFP